MKKAKKKALIIIVACLIILVGAFIADRILGKSYLKELKYDQVIEKVENKDSFVLLLSQTTCSHCMDFKPKLAKVAKEYKVEVFVIDGEEKTAANRINGDVSKEKIISKLKSNGFID